MKNFNFICVCSVILLLGLFVLSRSSYNPNDYTAVKGKIIEMKYEPERFWMEKFDENRTMRNEPVLKYDDRDPLLVIVQEKEEGNKVKVIKTRFVYPTEKEYSGYKLGERVDIPNARIVDGAEALEMNVENLVKYEEWLQKKRKEFEKRKELADKQEI